MRTGPTDKARAILTVPASASVGLIGCKSWCEITYKGNRGFIYKSFLDGQPASNRKQVRKKAPKPTTTASSDLMAPKAAQGLPGVWNTPVRQR